MRKRMLTAGVLGTARKENEHRLPIHPDHFERVPAECRPALRFETGYGRAFGVDEERLRAFSAVSPGRSVTGHSIQQVGLPARPAPLLSRRLAGQISSSIRDESIRPCRSPRRPPPRYPKGSPAHAGFLFG